jgi:transposase
MGLSDMAGAKKKAREMMGWLVFQDESGVSQRPPLRRTWAPRGETPVVIHSYNWKKISICAAIAYRWDGKRTRLYFQLRGGSYATESLISFLKELKKHFRQQYVILIWDGLPAHKSLKMKEYLQSQQGWLQVERLPGYSPDLNPVESLWGNIKNKELANQSADDLSEVATGVNDGFARIFWQRQLLTGFLNHSGLFFD